ncbi:MAG TPA: hypothetical protein VK464_09515, partial [Symbiobacteriaceae bacterium]|nr:hypothetical protein [Symbiobacteriaceae bacterium]
AGLVGFAASGPVNLPVRIEGERAFAEIFGADLDLVWDGEEGRVHRAFLGPAVRSFFRNGGKSCWVVRVADVQTAVAGRFQIPGLAVALPGGGFGATVLSASSPGSWSDDLCVGATLRSTTLTGIEYRPDGWVLHDEVAAGDLLRLSRRLSGETWQFYLFAETVSPADAGSWQVEGPVFWFGPAGEIPLGTVRVTRGATPGAGAPATAAGDGVEWMPAEPAPPGAAPTEGVWRQQPSSDRLWQLILPHDRTILPGTVLDVSDGKERLLFPVAAVAEATAEDQDLCGAAMVSRAGRLMVATGRPPLRPVAPDALPDGLLDGRWSVERLTLDLWAEDADGMRRVAGGLGFHPAHSLYLGYLPTDNQLFTLYTAGRVQPDGAPAWDALTPLITSPRFPLAVESGDTPLYLPLAADTQTDLLYQPQPRLRNPRPALERDGLEDLDVSLFVAPEMEHRDDADLSRAVATTTQPVGIHALWPIEEVTLVAVPDAVHLGWPALLELRPSMAGVREVQPDAGAPVLARPRMAGPGPYTLRWTPVGATRYVLQVGRHDPDFAAPAEYVTEELSYTLWWDGKGVIHFRVAPWPEGQPAPGPWSSTVTLREPDNRWPFWYRHPTPGNIADATAFITRVHTALLRMARTRGDLFAVMALPREFSIRDALGYVRHLTRSVQADTRSFGAIFAPWLQFQEGDGSTTPVPPDGAALGQIAGRTIAQGVWVAPANLPLQSVADLDRSIDGQPLDQLSDAQVNVYVQEVLGCVAHTANTLSTDSDLMPLGTRRLVSLLRRILTDAGMDAVFQPDDRRHRLAVKARLDQELSDLFLRGALAGDTAAQAFQVTADDTVNPPGSVKEGRLIVNIRIAPARSLTFLTIRLFENQAGRPVVTEG